jgi:hypothetical protein
MVYSNLCRQIFRTLPPSEKLIVSQGGAAKSPKPRRARCVLRWHLTSLSITVTLVL